MAEHECAEANRKCVADRAARVAAVVAAAGPDDTNAVLAERAVVSVRTITKYRNKGVERILPQNMCTIDGDGFPTERFEAQIPEPSSARLAAWTDEFLSWPLHVQKQMVSVLTHHYRSNGSKS